MWEAYDDWRRRGNGGGELVKDWRWKEKRGSMGVLKLDDQFVPYQKRASATQVGKRSKRKRRTKAALALAERACCPTQKKSS